MTQEKIIEILDAINLPLGYVLLISLAFAGIWFTIKIRGAQFRMLGNMVRLVVARGEQISSDPRNKERIPSFQAFCVTLASRIGTGNLAGVATAIFLGGPGAVFWMWVMALVASSNAFIESTLAQIYKVRDGGRFIGGPAYYIRKGLNNRWLAIMFAVSCILAFGIGNNAVQSNTITLAFTDAFGVSGMTMAILLSALTAVIIFGGLKRVAQVSAFVVPIMAVAYILLAIYVISVNITQVPSVISLIVKNAFGIDQFMGGGVGSAIVVGFKRGLFSNEAGEGSAPNAAASADVSHPVKQGLLQTLGVFSDTLIICTCTALIILLSGVYNSGKTGIELNQMALSSHIGELGRTFISIAIFCFAYTSILGNYFYAEVNLRYLYPRQWIIRLLGLIVTVIIFLGAIMQLEVAWGFVDIFMTIMTLCNLIGIFLLGDRAVAALHDYINQTKQGKNPEYTDWEYLKPEKKK